MNRLASLLFAALAFVIFVSCSKKSDEIRTNMNNLGNIQKASENVQKNLNAGQAKREERIKRGDTLAMNYTRLREYLPTSIPGYKSEDTDGQTTNMGGFSLSTVTRRFTKEGDEGSYIEIQLVDYNQAADMYQGLTFWAAGIESESDTKFERTFKPPFDNAVAYEVYNKKDKTAEVTYALDWRFILSLKASKQDGTDFLKQIATNSMKTKELSSL
jgi:hypothetical protein